MIVNSWTANQLLLKNLKDTNKYLLGQVSELEETGHEELFGLVVDLINGGGKMLRPALVFLFNDLGDNPAATKDVEPVAGALEILHPPPLFMTMSWTIRHSAATKRRCTQNSEIKKQFMPAIICLANFSRLS